MFGKFSGKHQTNSGLDFAAGKGGLLVVGGELSGLGSDALEDVVDEGVHDGHSLLGDTSIGVDLFQDLVDVRGVTLGTLLSLLDGGGCLFGCLLGGFLGGSLGHLRSKVNREEDNTRNDSHKH